MSTTSPQHVRLGSGRPPVGLAALTLHLTRARFTDHSGERLLYGAAVLAAFVCSATAFTLAGGTWMFAMRAEHPTGLLAQVQAGDPVFATILDFYLGLACLACALVLPALMSLVAAGAQLGARGRERRLAVLRLVGLSSGDVTRMALLDALAQSVLGTTLGLVAYRASLPSWGRTTFQAVPVRAEEMVLPWWACSLVGVGLVVLNVAAAAYGLRQVMISPLGVSRRVNRPAARRWRIALFVVAVVVAMVAAPASLTRNGGLYVLVGIVVLLLLAVNVAGPWLLQLVARGLTRLPSPTAMTAARRIIADPAATWRRVSTLGVLAFIGGYLGSVPFSYDDRNGRSQAERSFMEGAQADMVHGAVITLALGFVVTATALLITQSSATIERADQARALHRLGAPDGFHLRVMWLETFVPLLLTTVVSGLLGVWAASPMARMVRKAGLDHGQESAPVAVVMVCGLLVVVLALLVNHPLHRSLLRVDRPGRD